MPKAWAVENLTTDMPLSQAASLILQVKLPEVLHYERGVIRGTVNSVHDMRIGSKRLREAVRVLKPAIPAKDRARLLPTVEQLNDLLGEVRDRDVLRGALQKLAKTTPEAVLPPRLLQQLDPGGRVEPQPRRHLVGGH
ncbi:MAG: CHAD domain-containing protein, partial [Armatimonadota bacterium]